MTGSIAGWDLIALPLLSAWRRSRERCGRSVIHIAINAAGRLDSSDGESMPNRHIGSRNPAPLSHQHRGIVAHRLYFAQAKGFQRDQRLHALVSWEDQHLDRIQRDAVAGQELLQMLVNNLGEIVNLFVDRFERRNLHEPVHSLLTYRAGISAQLITSQPMSLVSPLLHQSHPVS